MGCKQSKENRGTIRIADRFVDGGTQAYKVVTMGDKGVGKSSIVMRFTKDIFNEHTEAPTIGAAFVSQFVPVRATSRTGTTVDQQVKLHIWDTSGEEAYRSITKSFFRDSFCAFLVFDVTKKHSFRCAESWIKEFKALCPDAFVVMLANKADKADERVVSSAEAQTFADQHDMPVFETSAKTRLGINEAFLYVAKRLAGV